MIGQLNTTTGKVLTNTGTLHQKVNNVAGQLQELNRQSAILQQQMQTGANLSGQLQTQTQLTAHGVDLMQQILQRQVKTEQLTSTMAAKSLQIQQVVGQSVSSLQALQTAIAGSLHQSQMLNQQMSGLQNELAVSQDEFKFFGQLDALLNQPVSKLQQLLSSLVGGASRASGSSGTSSGLLGSLPTAGSLSGWLGGLTGTPH
ncbi:hypothetical protein GCM10025857_14050 [Alicyclobacillus contaminans]|nr:hypothetical protein GCM10025857_14050 [Alicyclobacillus contaminans]